MGFPSHPRRWSDDILHRKITAVDDYSQSPYDHWFHVSSLPLDALSGNCSSNGLNNKKGALSSPEDESAPYVGKMPGPKRQTHLFGNPAILLGQDPWLCVTRLLWFCPFGEPFEA